MASASKQRQTGTPPVYIVSGGNGASGRQLVDTVLVQYPELEVPVVMMTNIRHAEQIETIVSKAAAAKALLVHTLVDSRLRTLLVHQGKEKQVATLDLMEPLFHHLTKVSGQQPLEQPGLYRILRQSYYDRVAAIDFTMEHDDGQKPEELHLAEIVLIGVSRSGKTPLSMYLAVLGWKVANIVIVPGITLPDTLSQVDRRRIFGLDIDHDRILKHRRHRQEQFGMAASSGYVDAATVFEELETARRIFKKYRFTTIDVTDKAIETSAAEILELMDLRMNPQG